jgi:hypothetical protein
LFKGSVNGSRSVQKPSLNNSKLENYDHSI